jgi:hypothetical protein
MNCDKKAGKFELNIDFFNYILLDVTE